MVIFATCGLSGVTDQKSTGGAAWSAMNVAHIDRIRIAPLAEMLVGESFFVSWSVYYYYILYV